MGIVQVEWGKGVDWARVDEAFSQHSINLLGSSLRALQLSGRDPQLLRSPGGNVMVRMLTDIMMHHHMVLLHLRGRLPNNTDHLDLLSHRSRNAIQRRELAHAVSCDDAAGAVLGSGIAVCG